MEKNIFRDEAGLVFGFSKKNHGDMKIWPGEANSEATANRRRFFNIEGLNVDNVISALVIHGDQIFVAESLKGYYVIDHDAIMTSVPEVIIAMTAADCPPIFLYDPVKKVIALAHSGWKGTILNIAEKTVNKMGSFYGCEASDIQAFIGPHIRACHFIVGPEIAEKFADIHVAKWGNEVQVSLASVISSQLLKAGLKMDNVTGSEICTSCNKKYFSFRRDKPERVQAGIAYLGIKA